MTTELVLLGTAGAPMPVAGRAGIASALVVDGRVFVVDCGRGAPSSYVEAGLDFTRLEAVFLSHLHVDHTGDLAGMLLYPWGVRAREDGAPLAPVCVYGPGAPHVAPAGAAPFTRETTIHPERPFPGVTDLVDNILAGYAYHLNVMPLDCRMPDPGSLVRAVDIPVPAPVQGAPRTPVRRVRRRDRPGDHRSRDPRPRAPLPRLPVRHPGRCGGVLRGHDGERRPDCPRQGRRRSRPSGCGPRLPREARPHPGSPSIAWPGCRPTSARSVAWPNAHRFESSS